MIKAIVFDWSGVLAENAVDHMAGALAKRYRIDNAVAWSAVAQYHPKFEKGKDYQEYMRKVTAMLKIPEKAIMRSATGTQLSKTYSLARMLSRKHRVYLLSDQMHWRTEQIKAESDLSFFKAAFFSSETGYVKSEKRAFANFLKKTGQKAGECLFIDDNAKNVKVARQAGFKAILYSSHKMLLKQLKALGVR